MSFKVIIRDEMSIPLTLCVSNHKIICNFKKKRRVEQRVKQQLSFVFLFRSGIICLINYKGNGSGVIQGCTFISFQKPI